MRSVARDAQLLREHRFEPLQRIGLDQRNGSAETRRIQHPRVAGGEHHRQLGPALAHLLRQCKTVALRHHHIREQQVDLDAGIENGERLATRCRAQHAAAEAFDQHCRGGETVGIIVDHQHDESPKKRCA
jgi:hypothetical protein